MKQTPYTIASSGTLVLDNESRRYLLKVRDLPNEEKPRERLSQHGPDALSTAELLAVVLSTGTKKEEIMAMTRRIIKEYGETGVFSEKSPAKLARNLDIPLGKAMQIIACGELGRRFFRKNEHGMPVLRTAEEVYEYTRDMRTLTKEHVRGLYLNSHYKLIHDETISIGTLDANMLHPRDVFKPAVEYAAAAVILVHNHPSGIAEPSQADTDVTAQLVKAGRLLGITLVDHVIVTKTAFTSIPLHE